MKFWPRKGPLSDDPIGSCIFDWCVICFYLGMFGFLVVAWLL